MENILQKINLKAGFDLVSLLSERLSGSDLNSLLIEVFQRRTSQIAASELLQHYKLNPFVKPAETDVLRLRQKELESLTLLAQNGFEPLELSPVSQLGTCSVLATVNQKKVISATRGTEVLADATNAIAMHIAHLRKTQADFKSVLKFCTTHRHVRTPKVQIEGFTPHFKIVCMVTSGRDNGDFEFEKKAVEDHFRSLEALLKQVLNIKVKYFKLVPRAGYAQNDRLISKIFEHVSSFAPVTVDYDEAENNYYSGIQFKAVIEISGKEIEIADGGFVNWTQKLLQNKKQRFFISGLGLEYLDKLLR